MIWSWVLLIIISSSNGIDTEKIEGFPSESSCQSAMKDQSFDSDLDIEMSCIKTSIPLPITILSNRRDTKPTQIEKPNPYNAHRVFRR